MIPNILTRECPKCAETLTYRDKYIRNRAELDGSLCVTCTRSGRPVREPGELRELAVRRGAAHREPVDGTLLCTRCRKMKEPTEFSPMNRNVGKRKYQYWCKVCACAYGMQDYEKNKDRYKRHADNRTKRIRVWLASLKTESCADCDRSYPPYVMDWDHRDGTDKIDNISRMSRWSRLKILDEIAKCDLVCANCHRQRSHDRIVAAGQWDIEAGMA